MSKDSRGFLVSVHSKLGKIDSRGDIESHWVDGEDVNSSLSVFHRSYTDENGVRRLNGVFEDVYQAKDYMYKLAGQTVDEMLRKGWVDIKVDEKRENGASSAVVTVFGKTKVGGRGWRQSYSLIKGYKEKEQQ